jgi:hypothetical protein
MNITFGKLWNLLESEQNKLLDIIRTGNSLKKPDCGNFWDDFINLCGNADSVAALLDVPKEKVTSWSGTINKLRKEAEIKDSDKSHKKHKIIKNGEM